MPFVNEYISQDDMKRFDIEAISDRFVVGGVPPCQWTIDRERNIYLRILTRGREEFSHISKWSLFWKGDLVICEVHGISTIGDVYGHRHGHKRLSKISIPPHLESKRTEILNDLVEAFTAYKDGGVFSTATDYTLTLDI